MKISELWLREWASPKLSTQALADRLTLAGLELGAVTPVSAPLPKVVVGEIVALTPHPQADRLRVCQVNIGKAKPLTIVCGAANAAAGLKAPTALVGATLPNGTEIRQAQIRGVDSAGMLCSAAELGLAESAEGLLELDADAKPGAAIADYLHLDDQQLEVELTPNRGDCLSIAGLAREVAALTGVRMRVPARRAVKPKHTRRLKVTVSAREDCARYCGRIVDGITPSARTPLWMRERLRRAGLRSIHPVVDVTNYVMLELGQPMHAFDLATLDGGITVRHARKGEALALLDGSDIKTSVGTLVIADERRALALAGIMGGADSAVTATTTRLFLESAWFRPDIIGPRAREYGLHTDSSHRFERGVDPQLQRDALERATALIIQICGGQPGPVVEQSSARHLPKRAPITLRAARLASLLGAAPPAREVDTILGRLGMRSQKLAGGWRVTPPSWRFDIVREVDLIEEVARVRGYENIPRHRPAIALTLPAVPEGRVLRRRIVDALIDRDYQEAITYSFVDPAWLASIDPDHQAAVLANPIASDMAAMRTTLWAGLLQAVLHNQNRQQTRIRLFELGRRFLPARGGATDEQPVVAGAITGAVAAPQWGIPGRAVDFFDLKGDVEALLALTGQSGGYRFQPGRHPALHPGQSAQILGPDDRLAGVLGALHPDLQAKLGLDRPVYLFELPLAALEAARLPAFREVSRFPAIRRDLAVVVDRAVPAQKVLDCVANVAGSLLVNLELFDEYRGEGIDSGRKSLALGLTLQDSSRTLKDDEVEALVTRVVTALGAELDAQLRQ